MSGDQATTPRDCNAEFAEFPRNCGERQPLCFRFFHFLFRQWFDETVVLMEALEFIGAERPDLLETIESLRIRVWSTPFLDSIRDSLMVDAIDLQAMHVLCLSSGQPVGSGRISIHSELSSIPDRDNFAPWIKKADLPIAFLNRLVVEPAYRKRGIANRIDRARIAYAKRIKTVPSLFVEATGTRIEALTAMGFAILGESADKRYPGRWLIMKKRL